MSNAISYLETSDLRLQMASVPLHIRLCCLWGRFHWGIMHPAPLCTMKPWALLVWSEQRPRWEPPPYSYHRGLPGPSAAGGVPPFQAACRPGLNALTLHFSSSALHLEAGDWGLSWAISQLQLPLKPCPTMDGDPTVVLWRGFRSL